MIAISLPLKSSISFKYVFVAVSDLGPPPPPKKKIIGNLALAVQFSLPRKNKGRIPPSPGTESSQMANLCPWGGGGDVGVSIYAVVIQETQSSYKIIQVNELVCLCACNKTSFDGLIEPPSRKILKDIV